MKLDGFACEMCGERMPVRAFGLVRWVSLIRGYRREDGGAEQPLDFCSQDCLVGYLAITAVTDPKT